jgi:hypothetical protein
MKYTEEELLAYARSHIRVVDQQKGKRLVVGFMGIGGIGMLLCFLEMVKDKSEKIGVNLFLDERFIEGVAMGVLLCVTLGLSALGVMRMFSFLYGKEIEAFRLLVRLKDERSGYPPKPRTPTGGEGEG